MLAFMICECQILMLPLDVVNSRENTNIDMFIFWQVIYMSSLFMTTIIIPFAFFFYDTDEDVDHVSNRFWFINVCRKRGFALLSEMRWSISLFFAVCTSQCLRLWDTLIFHWRPKHTTLTCTLQQPIRPWKIQITTSIKFSWIWRMKNSLITRIINIGFQSKLTKAFMSKMK